MRSAVHVCFLAGAVALAFAAQSRTVEAGPSRGVPIVVSASMVEAPMQATGRAVFEGKGNCATCHGSDARGTPLGPDLTDDEWLNISGTLEEITRLIRSGITRPKKYPAPMPPMGGARLRDAEVEAVARYVFELSHPGAAALRR